MVGNEEWRKGEDIAKMATDDLKSGGPETAKRPPGQNPGSVLHQRRSLPFSPYTMAAGGLLIAAGLGYMTLYSKKKPEASATDVAKVTTGVAKPEETHPRK